MWMPRTCLNNFVFKYFCFSLITCSNARCIHKACNNYYYWAGPLKCCSMAEGCPLQLMTFFVFRLGSAELLLCEKKKESDEQVKIVYLICQGYPRCFISDAQHS